VTSPPAARAGAPAYVTVYTLVLIAVVRYMTIVHGARTAALRRRSRVVAALAVTWIGMLLVNAPILDAYAVRRVGEAGLPDCDLREQRLGRPIFATFFAFGYLVPLCVIAVFSLLILAHLRARHRASSVVALRSQSRQRRVTRMLVLIVVVFAALWLPIHVHLLMAFFGHIPTASPVYMTLGVVWNCLAYANSCVNPIIYNYTCKDFRAAFRSIVQSCCSSGSVHDDGVREVSDHDAVDDVDGNDDDDDEDENAIELQLHTDVTVVGRIRPVGCNRTNAVPLVRLESPYAADAGSA